jgi:hypothetical protein
MRTRLPLETQTLYAELLEHLIGVYMQRSIGHLQGSFTEKRIKGQSYLYWQASQPGGTTRQFYLGRRSTALEEMVRRFTRSHAQIAPDLDRVHRLAAQLRAGGANVTDGPSARVVRSLAESGMFEAGAVLVGTHAFAVLGNVLGVRWSSAALRTQDVDLASAADADIDLAVPEAGTDLPSVLESLQMGFLPVPPLDPRQPSTSFKVRGQSLRVDLLCPQRGSAERPVFIPRFKAAAQPLAFMDYLLEAPERALVINGGAALVNVPTPARFALHKLLVAPLRPAAFQSKASKDVAQASEVLDLLMEDRPGDLALAWQALTSRGPRWERAGRKGLALLRGHSAGAHRRLLPLLGPRRLEPKPR